MISSIQLAASAVSSHSFIGILQVLDGSDSDLLREDTVLKSADKRQLSKAYSEQ
jgi:hypothetical protein